MLTASAQLWYGMISVDTPAVNLTGMAFPTTNDLSKIFSLSFGDGSPGTVDGK